MDVRWLLIDSCGEVATVAVGCGDRVLVREEMVGRQFSAGWPTALRGLLENTGFAMKDVHVVAVVHGPGSFTGVRVGLAAAKGLCEATGAKLVTLDRSEAQTTDLESKVLTLMERWKSEAFANVSSADALYERGDHEMYAKRPANA